MSLSRSGIVGTLYVMHWTHVVSLHYTKHLNVDEWLYEATMPPYWCVSGLFFIIGLQEGLTGKSLTTVMHVKFINTLRPIQKAAICQTTFWNAFSWMKMYEFRLKFHWSLFLGVQLYIYNNIPALVHIMLLKGVAMPVIWDALTFISLW